MRTKAGDRVEVVNGQGILATAQVEQIDKKLAQLHIDGISSEPKDPFEIILAQAIPRINRLDTILEKGTELGMTQIWLFPGDCSERKELNENQLKRAKGILIAAMKQCGRLWVPQILEKPSLKKWDELGYPAYFGDVKPSAKPFAAVLKESRPKDGVIFFTGPESGFSEGEEKILEKLGAMGVKLHSNILRTDTASLVALTLLSQGKL
jgi:16S rRNA (uracil1498-N3)-methyltransferase